MATLEVIFLNRRKSKVKKKFSQTMFTLMTLLLWISPGWGEDKPSDCTARDFRFCASPCAYLRDRCNGNRECSLDLCSYLHPFGLPYLQNCWNLFFECSDDYRLASKRGLLNRDMAYLLLKLHPFVNQTSQFGFLTSGRFRRISGNLGTEFLGKRGNNKPNESRSLGGGDQNRSKSKPLSTPQFYSLPLNKLSKAKILKREEDFLGTEKRLGMQGNGKVVLGSEFLGKRAEGRKRRVTGSEFLGKRNTNPFDGSEFLGKRTGAEYLGGTEFLGKRNQEDLLGGTELLGKKNTHSALEYLFKRFGNELLGKRLGWGEVNPEFSNEDENDKKIWARLTATEEYSSDDSNNRD